ncbi:MAG: fibronectin type III domain-containing protein [Parcubacteria group bacterium]
MTRTFRKTTKILLPAMAFAVSLLLIPNVKAAEGFVITGDLPFTNTNLVPGGVVTKTITVQNNFGVDKKLGLSATGSDSSGLASQITLKVTGDGANYEESFDEFLKGNWIFISTISAGASKTHTLTLTFAADALQNEYEGKSLTFDLNVGSCDVNDSACTIISVGPEQGTGGGGGGAGYNDIRLIISNDRNDEPVLQGGDPQTATVIVRWNTNIPASSQVVYGLSGGSYVLDLNNLPNLGYPLGTSEINISPKVTNHIVALTGLTPGETYKYRVVSRASPPTVSFEKEFTVPVSGETDIQGGRLSLGGSEQAGGINSAPSGTGGNEEQVGDENNLPISESNDNARGLATILAAMGNWFSKYWWMILIVIFVLVIGYLIGRFAKSRKRKAE